MSRVSGKGWVVEKPSHPLPPPFPPLHSPPLINTQRAKSKSKQYSQLTKSKHQKVMENQRTKSNQIKIKTKSRAPTVMAKHEAESTPLHDNHLQKPECQDPALAWRRRRKLGVIWHHQRPLGVTWRHRSYQRKLI